MQRGRAMTKIDLLFEQVNRIILTSKWSSYKKICNTFCTFCLRKNTLNCVFACPLGWAIDFQYLAPGVCESDSSPSTNRSSNMLLWNMLGGGAHCLALQKHLTQATGSKRWQQATNPNPAALTCICVLLDAAWVISSLDTPGISLLHSTKVKTLAHATKAVLASS